MLEIKYPNFGLKYCKWNFAAEYINLESLKYQFEMEDLELLQDSEFYWLLIFYIKTNEIDLGLLNIYRSTSSSDWCTEMWPYDLSGMISVKLPE